MNCSIKTEIRIIKFFVDKNTLSIYRTAFLDKWLFMSPSFRNFESKTIFYSYLNEKKISNLLKTMLGLSLFVLVTITYIQHDVVAFSSTEGKYQWKLYLLLPWLFSPKKWFFLLSSHYLALELQMLSQIHPQRQPSEPRP